MLLTRQQSLFYLTIQSQFFNQACYPGSVWCSGFKDPHILMNGTQTIFPLNSNKALIFTNLSWVRNPHGKPLEKRPHPNPWRPAIFLFPQHPHRLHVNGK